MISFESDYIMGAHPEILKRLTETNFEAVSGYGADKYCESAKEKIKVACACPEADVWFLVGGTQSNAVVISSMLRRYEGVIAAETGHIGFHEAGAIEYTGHKVFLLPQSVWSIGTAAACIVIGTLFSALLGFLSAMYPAVKSAGLEPQSAITQGEVN